MKTALASLLILSSLSANATTCLGETQVVLRVSAAKNCIATIDSQQVALFNSNPACPLNLNEVLNKGIQDCTLRAEDKVKGLLVLTDDGKIIRD